MRSSREIQPSLNRTHGSPLLNLNPAQNMSYPSYVNNEPPTVTLKEYDSAPWAGTTCVDKRNNGYVIVVMEKPEQVVAKVHPDDSETLDTIFKSAHQDFSDQLVEHKGQVPRK